MTERYRRNIGAKALLLRRLADAGEPTGAELRDAVQAACMLARDRDPQFDFVFWAGGTVWTHIELFKSCGFLVHSGGPPVSSHDWKVCSLRITDAGLKYLREAEAEAGDVMRLFAPDAQRVVSR